MVLSQIIDLCGGEKDHHGLTMKRKYEGYLPVAKRTNLNNSELTEDEIFILIAYTGSSSSWINEDLRDGRRLSTPCKEHFALYLDSVLKKVCSFSNNIVFRMDFPSGEAKEILFWFQKQINKRFLIPYYLSTSKKDYKNSQIVWRIETAEISRGKDISDFSNSKGEQEILFERNSKFKVIGIDSQTNYVFLQELDHNSEIDFELNGSYYLNS